MLAARSAAAECAPAKNRTVATHFHMARPSLGVVTTLSIDSGCSAILDVNVLERQHAGELLLRALGKAATLGELDRVAVRAEHPVPQRDVAEVVLVHVELVVDRVQLRRL